MNDLLNTIMITLKNVRQIVKDALRNAKSLGVHSSMMMCCARYVEQVLAIIVVVL